MQEKILVRILASIVLLLSVLFMPFWLSVILGLAGMVYFSLFWEATVLFLLSDLLYGTKSVQLFNMMFVSFITSVIVLTALELFKKKLKYY